MPKFRFLADVDSVVDEAEHLESIFEDGIEAVGIFTQNRNHGTENVFESL